MLLKNALVLALLLAAAIETDAGHTVRGEKHNDNTRERRIKKTKKKTKPTNASSSGGGAVGTGGATTPRAGGAAGGTINRAGGAGGGKKKKSGTGGKKSGSGGQPIINRFGTPGGPSYTPQVWSPGNLRGSTTPNFDVGQNGQPAEGPVPIPIGSIGNKAGGTGPTYNVYIQPANTPTTPGVTTGWSGVNRGGGNIAMTGQQCQSSNPNKFRCCNNEGSGACAAAGFGDCCDSFRNICVNTASLNPTARSNLVCKP